MIDFTPALIGFALYLLIWEKLPDWGTWFVKLLNLLPGFLKTLYEQWVCAYCVGFWLGLMVHWVTGLWTIEALRDLPEFWGPAGPAIGWFLDALATGTIIYFLKNILDAIRLPAMKANMMRDDYIKFWEEKANQKD